MLVCLLFYEIYLFAYTFLLYLFSRLGTANSRTTINRINSRSASLRSHGDCYLVGTFQSGSASADRKSTSASVKRKRFLHSNGSVSHHSTCKFSQESSAKNTNMSKYIKLTIMIKNSTKADCAQKLYDEKWKHSQLCSCRYCWNFFDVHK